MAAIFKEIHSRGTDDIFVSFSRAFASYVLHNAQERTSPDKEAFYVDEFTNLFELVPQICEKTGEEENTINY